MLKFSLNSKLEDGIRFFSGLQIRSLSLKARVFELDLTQLGSLARLGDLCFPTHLIGKLYTFEATSSIYPLLSALGIRIDRKSIIVD